MLTENTFNYRMEYPGVYVPSLSSTYYQMTPPYSHPYDSPPSSDSAFTPVSKIRKLSDSPDLADNTTTSSSSFRQTFLDGSPTITIQPQKQQQPSFELLSRLFQPSSSYNHFYSSQLEHHHHNGYSTQSPQQHHKVIHTSTPPLIKQLLLQKNVNKSSIHNNQPQLSLSSAGSSSAEDDEVIFINDNQNKNRNELIHRTSVIMKVDERNYIGHLRSNNNGLTISSSSPSSPLSTTSSSSSSTSSAATAGQIDEEFICKWESCLRVFESLEHLATHVTHTHAIASVSGLYYCKWHLCCRSERGFNARYKMLVHVRTHTKEKPHQCQQCEKSFSRAENLKIHTRSHSGEKPYVCPVEGCKKAYSNSSDRFKHTRTHSTEKPYFCKVVGCNKRYTDPSSLRKHVKTFKHSTHIISFDELVKPYKQQQQQPLIHQHQPQKQFDNEEQHDHYSIVNYHHPSDITTTTEIPIDNKNHQQCLRFHDHRLTCCDQRTIIQRCNCNDINCYEKYRNNNEMCRLGNLFNEQISIPPSNLNNLSLSSSPQSSISSSSNLAAVDGLHEDNNIYNNCQIDEGLKKPTTRLNNEILQTYNINHDDLPLDLSFNKIEHYKHQI